MATQVTFDALSGFGIGYQYATAKYKEDEVKQGKNYWVSGILQSVQIMQLGSLIAKLAERTFVNRSIWPVKLLCNVVPILTLPFTVAMGGIKLGEYEQLANLVNKNYNCPIKLPVTLSERTIKVARFLAEHLGDIIRVAMIVGAVAMVALGHTIFGGACLLALGLEAIDRLGWVPRKISLFMERYLPVIANIGMMIGGTLISRIFSFVSVTLLYSPFTHLFYKQVDQFARSKFTIPGPSIKEIEAPLVERKNFTAQEMNQILDGYSYEYEANPAACSKWVTDFSSLPTNYDFDQLNTLFDSVPWLERYPFILAKLKNDEIYLDKLVDQFPNATRKEIQKDAESYIKQLAAKENLPVEQYVVNWIKSQMVQLVKGLNGNRRVPGSQMDLQEAIDISAKVLPAILYFKEQAKIFEFEDALLMLAIEGGDYCSREVKRCATELLGSVLHHGYRHVPNADFDAVKDYEMKLRQSLQEQRMRIVESYFKLIQTDFLSALPERIQSDVHVFDVYRTYLSYGFYPITEFERAKIGIPELITWELYGTFRDAMYKDYKITEGAREVGLVNMYEYIIRTLKDNSALNQQERTAILEKLSERNNGAWSVDDSNARAARLVYMMLGILRKKPN